MKKILFILCLCCLAILPLQASIIDVLQSQDLAVGFVSDLDGVSTTNITINGTTTVPSSFDISRPVLHIINTQERGTSNARFVIVSGDSRARYILAYGDDELDLDNIPEGLQDFIDMYKEQIEAMIENYPDEVAMFTSDGGNDADSTVTVEPLITTMWGQGRPFNNRCPVYDGPVHYIDTVCSTGCGSTALAMIFKYYNFADSYSTIPEYTTESLNIHLDALEPIDFDWNNMLDIYEEGSYTDEQADAVAWLMRYIGQSEKMNYTPGSSACKVRNIEKTLMAFGYSYKKVNKGSCDDRAWAAMIQAELLAGQPVLYLSGQSEDSNHAYIIDGYDADGDRYHINWGWSGNGNAHCALNAFKPSNSPSIYSHHQMMYINVHPAEKAITVDKDTLTLEEYTGYTCVESFTVSGHSGQDIHLEIEDDSLHQFSVDPSVITPTEALNGKTVNVYFNPHFSGAAQATLTLSNDSIVPVDIILNGYGIKSDGDIILDSTYVKITSTVYKPKPGQVNQGRIMRIHFFWQGAEENNQIMIGAPSSDGDRFLDYDPHFFDYDPIDIDDLVTESFTTEIIGDSCYEADLIVCSNISDALTTNHGDFSIILFYSFPTLGKHDAILKISHKSLSVKPQYVHLNGMAVWPADAQYIPGDANGDGIVDVDDVITLIAYVLSNATTINTEAADMNFDGVIDISDITQLIQHILDGNPVIIPTISSSVTSLNFGTAASGNEITKTFTITGTYLTGNLTLSSSSPYYTVTPTTITADEAASGTTVTVVYNPTEEGTHNATLTISGGDAESKTVSLSGECVPTIITGASSLNFGSVASGDEQSKTFTVSGTGLTGNLTLSSSSSYFTVTPATITPEAAATGQDITVKFKPDLATVQGTYNATLTISGGGAESKTVSLKGECVYPLILTDVTSLEFTENGSKQFTVSGYNWPDNLTLSITGSESQYFSLSRNTLSKSEADNGATITVDCYAPITKVDASAQIIISGGGSFTKTIDLSYHKLPADIEDPTISTSATSLNFGEVKLGDASTDTFTVVLEYTTPWAINSISNLTLSSSNPCYTVSPTMISPLDAIAGQTVTVTYTPTTVGTDTATITISGGHSESKTVSLTGECVIPTIITSSSSLNFGKVTAGDEKSQTFTVLGTWLTGNLTLSCSSPCYTISPTTITPAEAQIGKTVTVTYAPTAAGSDTGTITISGGGAESKTVRLIGECLEQVNLPVILTSTSSIEFTESGSKQFTVSGFNWPDNLTLSITGSGSQYFSLDRTTISKSEADNGATITVYCNAPSNLVSARAQIVIGSGGSYTKTIDLSYNPYPPIISTSTTYLNFGEVLLGNEKTNTFTVTLETTHPGILSNLSNLTLSSSNPCYTISPATISPVEATIGKTVIVTYTPTNVGNDVAAITISGCGAESKTVILSGEGVVPVIRTNYTTLDFTERETKHLKVTGTHLIGDVTLTLTGADSSYFHLSKTSISMDDAAHGATVSVNCSPSVHTQNASAQIIISSPGAETKTVNLNYNQGQSVTIN